MKSRILFFVFLASAVVILSSAYIQQSAEQLYQSGLYKEEVEGELEGAIEIYEKILVDFPENESTAAKALYHIGMCYEKLGKQEALKAYQRLIDEYPGQKQEVALAKERLARLTEAMEKVPHKPTFRKLRIPTKLSWTMQLSPDGKKVIFASASDRKLWMMPLSGKLGSEFPGAPVILNTDDVEVDWSGLAWSGDGKWIVFNEWTQGKKWKENEGKQGMYIVSAVGGKPKKVYENYRDARVVNYRMSLSPDGKVLAFSSVDSNECHINTISVDGGSPKQLVDAQAREPVFSPDGKMIAYVDTKNLGRARGGLWVIPTSNGTPKLVVNAKNASSPTWSPEGDMIAFVDYGDEVGKIHIIPIGEDGEAAGEKITIDAPEGIQEVRLLSGWTPDNKIGAIFVSRQEFGLYTLPAKGGKAALISHGGYPVQPRWSPDGKRIFHTNNVDDGSGDWEKLSLAVVPAEGGEVKTVPIQFDEKIVKPAWGGGNNVSPDGKTIVFSGQTKKDTSWHWQIWTLPVDGGKPKQLTKTPASVLNGFPCWSPDGQTIAYIRARNVKTGFAEVNIYIIPVNGGDPKALTSESNNVRFCPIAWSPDGKLIAYFSSDEENPDDITLKILSVNDSVSRVVAKVQTAHVNIELAWSPDSKRIAFNYVPKSKPYGKVIRVISIDDGSIVDIETDLVDTKIYHLDWSPDGKKLVFGGWQGGNREFWLMEDFLPLVKRRK